MRKLIARIKHARRSRHMYDSLGSLGATPEEVEASLHEFGYPTLRLKRSEAREMLDVALDAGGRHANTPPTDHERKQFKYNVLLNNVIISGSFHTVTVGGQILGCPLTLGFNLPNDTASGDREYPDWGHGFYGNWDLQAGRLADQRYDDQLGPRGGTVAFVLEGR